MQFTGQKSTSELCSILDLSTKGGISLWIAAGMLTELSKVSVFCQLSLAMCECLAGECVPPVVAGALHKQLLQWVSVKDLLCKATCIYEAFLAIINNATSISMIYGVSWEPSCELQP